MSADPFDPFDQLRLPDVPAEPDGRFVTSLRRRLASALDAADVPTVRLPERNPAMADTAAAATTPPVTSPSTGEPTATLIPYLSVAPAAAAIDWYVDVLGAVEHVRYVGDDGRVGHAELTIGGAAFMLADEYPDQGVPTRAPTTLGGTPLSMHLTVPDVDAVHDRVVADGRATLGRPPHDEAYGARSCDFVDPFGHRWMIQTTIAAPTATEIEAGMPGYTITGASAAASAPPVPARPPVEIGYVTMAAPDTAKAGRFYGALFGWSTEPGNLGDGYAHIDNTALPMGLTPGTVDDAPVLYFRVDDVPAYAARVRELGGEVIEQTSYESGPNAVCRDDQGRQFQLWQPAPGYE